MTTRYTTYENQNHQDDSSDEEAATLYIITEDEPETISYEDFLLENPEYLILTGDLFTDPPVWDEYDNETSFINPFATSELQQSVVGEKILEKFTLLEVDNDLSYPTRKPEHLLMSEANSNFNQVPTGSGLSNAVIGSARDQNRTINVPPINQWASTSTRPLGRIPDDKPIVLPPARAESGVFLTLPKNIARWEDAIRSWESSTIIHMAKMNFGDNTDKVIYFENLLGPKEKLDFQQWKAAYPDEYQRLIEIAGVTQNLTSQALSQLDRLTITDMKDFPDYAYQFHDLASKTGRMYLQTELSEKFFRKLPPPFGAKIMELWDRDHPGMGVGIVPRIKYTFEVLQQLCQQNEINRQAKDFSFCKSIEVPGAYPRNKPRRSLRRSTTYKGGAPHNNNLRKFKSKKPGTTTCKCSLCGAPGHFARDCKSSKVDRERLNIYCDLELPKDFDVISLQEGEDPNDSDICSYDDPEEEKLLNDFINMESEEQMFMMLAWRPSSAFRAATKLHSSVEIFPTLRSP
ncbi:hypothetical protein RIF29_12558 [Crotalaria pallida]|uniref:CCHC-type domain-containing protein n=1 Tax=Crotalaria pallida TaxID=3830 RepID=A0AAN9P122_CROPI